jgi:hypothetical protein
MISRVDNSGVFFLALIVPIAFGLYVLYIIIKRAVTAGIEEAWRRRADRPLDVQ